MTLPRPKSKVIYKPTTGVESWRIPKMDGPAPGSYNDEASFKTTINKTQFCT